MSQDKDKPNQKPPAPKVEHTQVPPPPPANNKPEHKEWKVDEGVDESFPASDAPSETQPKPTKKQ